MLAFEHFGSRCSGCGNYAEWCLCLKDSGGHLTYVQFNGVPPVHEMLVLETEDIDYLEKRLAILTLQGKEHQAHWYAVLIETAKGKWSEKNRR